MANKSYSYSVSYSDDKNRTKGITILCVDDDIAKAATLFTKQHKIDKKQILGIVKNII